MSVCREFSSCAMSSINTGMCVFCVRVCVFVWVEGGNWREPCTSLPSRAASHWGICWNSRPCHLCCYGEQLSESITWSRPIGTESKLQRQTADKAALRSVWWIPSSTKTHCGLFGLQTLQVSSVSTSRSGRSTGWLQYPTLDSRSARNGMITQC